MVDPVIGYS